jgi:hypothetical protein
MSLMVRDEGGIREKPMLGLHDAICCFVEDIGTHVTKTQYGNKAQHKIVVIWELDEDLKTGEYAGKPFLMNKQYTFTLFEKGNLAKDLESWFSKKISDETRKNGFDLHTLIGRKCQLNLVESEDGKFVNISNVLPASKTNNMIQVCTSCPEWVAKKRLMSLENTQQSNTNGEPLPDNQWPATDDESLPF